MKKADNISTEPIISIGTIAEKLGVSVSTIRKYEAEGLLIPHRVESGHRLFSVEDIARIKTIQRMIQEVGLNIEGIRRMQALIPCWDILPCEQKQRNKCPAYKDLTRPCWMIKDIECSSGSLEKCRNCIVYRFGSNQIEDIKKLVHGHDEKVRDSIRKTIEAWENNKGGIQ